MSRADTFSVSRGFSLTESLIVIVILGLLATVSTPWLSRIRRRAEFRSAAMEISTTLIAARMKAVKSNGNAGIRISPAAGLIGSHVIDTIEPLPPPPVPSPAANPAAKLMISGRSFRFVSMPVISPCPDLGVPACNITFDGGGRRVSPPSPTEASIVIEGPLGGGPVNQITIDTNAAGRVRIVTPVEWR